MKNENFTDAWRKYQQGIDFKNRIGLFNIVDDNERMKSGDHWRGSAVQKLPKPVLNLIGMIHDYSVAAVRSHTTSVVFTTPNVPDVAPEGQDLTEEEEKAKIVADVLSSFHSRTWERLKMDSICLSATSDGFTSGDGLIHVYFDPSIKTGQKSTGDIAVEILDNVNVYFGNPNSNIVENQPYVVIAMRELVADVKRQAKKAGLKKDEIDMISGDTDYQYQSGDMGKIELEDNGKCITLLTYWRDDDGFIYAEKSVKSVVFKPKWNTKLTRYPIALFNWKERKNCAHGTSDITALKPNQIYINQALAMAMVYTMNSSMPKTIYDSSRIKEWSNQISAVIPVNGGISDAAMHLNPSQMSIDIYKMLDLVIERTKQMVGAYDAAIGNIKNPDNMAAIVSTQEAASVPFESIQHRYYQFIEDTTRIFLDFWLNFYDKPRALPFEEDGVKRMMVLTLSDYKDILFDVKIDVGQGTKFSEMSGVKTLENFMMNDKIDFEMFLESVADKYVPNRKKILKWVKKVKADMQQPQQQQLPAASNEMPSFDMPQMPMQGGGKSEI